MIRSGSRPISLLTIALRAHLESDGAHRGMLALFADRRTARALQAMLGDLAHPWTLDELADHAHCARATLVRQFRKAVSAAALAFLAELRLTFARHRLSSESAPLAVIAEEVGYESETAFSRAYRRRFGVPPGQQRRKLATLLLALFASQVLAGISEWSV